MKYTIGTEISDDPYHLDIIKEKLTRTLPAVLPRVIDELKVAVQDHIPTQGEGMALQSSCGLGSTRTYTSATEWVSVNVKKTMEEIVARATNRAFVGLPLCAYSFFPSLGVIF